MGNIHILMQALSRGAARAVFVDMAADCCRTALKNADACGFTGRAAAVTARAEEVRKVCSTMIVLFKFKAMNCLGTSGS